jgi:hypothetical protein
MDYRSPGSNPGGLVDLYPSYRITIITKTPITEMFLEISAGGDRESYRSQL